MNLTNKMKTSVILHDGVRKGLQPIKLYIKNPLSGKYRVTQVYLENGHYDEVCMRVLLFCVCTTRERMMKNSRELFGLEPVSLMIKIC